MKILSLTDVGSSRSENQDNYWSAIAKADGVECCIACVCDGMGGLRNGREASRIVTQRVKEYSLEHFDFDGLLDVILSANAEIYSISGGNKSTMMGTTCSILYLEEGVFKILHIGDSRVYKLHNGLPEQLTEDHSAVVALKIDKDKEPQKWLKYRSKLTKCIGAKQSAEISMVEGTYSAGDKFFLCTDGVWHLFDSCQLDCDILDDLESLFKMCIDGGESDNLTAVVVNT